MSAYPDTAMILRILMSRHDQFLRILIASLSKSWDSPAAAYAYIYRLYRSVLRAPRVRLVGEPRRSGRFLTVFHRFFPATGFFS